MSLSSKDRDVIPAWIAGIQRPWKASPRQLLPALLYLLHPCSRPKHPAFWIPPIHDGMTA